MVTRDLIDSARVVLRCHLAGVASCVQGQCMLCWGMGGVRSEIPDSLRLRLTKLFIHSFALMRACSQPGGGAVLVVLDIRGSAEGCILNGEAHCTRIR